jgi:hypothetical protein
MVVWVDSEKAFDVCSPACNSEESAQMNQSAFPSSYDHPLNSNSMIGLSQAHPYHAHNHDAYPHDTCP